MVNIQACILNFIEKRGETSDSILKRIQPKNKASSKVITLFKQSENHTVKEQKKETPQKPRIVKEDRVEARLQIQKKPDIKAELLSRGNGSHTLITKSGGRVLIRKGEEEKKPDLREILKKSGQGGF